MEFYPGDIVEHLLYSDRGKVTKVPKVGEISVRWSDGETLTAKRENLKLVRRPPGEVRVTDPGTGGQKGRKPEDYSLIPVAPLAELARVYGYGASKYDAHNWRRGYRWSLSFSALMRHIEAFRSGESHDPESGFHHLAHAMFHLNTLHEFGRLGLGTDDRIKEVPA